MFIKVEYISLKEYIKLFEESANAVIEAKRALCDWFIWEAICAKGKTDKTKMAKVPLQLGNEE